MRWEIPIERREEDRSEYGDSEGARELLDGLEYSGGGANLVHADAGQDEVEQLTDARPGTESDKKQAGGDTPRRAGGAPGPGRGQHARPRHDDEDAEVEQVA